MLYVVITDLSPDANLSLKQALYIYIVHSYIKISLFLSPSLFSLSPLSLSLSLSVCQFVSPHKARQGSQLGLAQPLLPAPLFPFLNFQEFAAISYGPFVAVQKSILMLDLISLYSGAEGSAAAFRNDVGNELQLHFSFLPSLPPGKVYVRVELHEDRGAAHRHVHGRVHDWQLLQPRSEVLKFLRFVSILPSNFSFLKCFRFGSILSSHFSFLISMV